MKIETQNYAVLKLMISKNLAFQKTKRGEIDVLVLFYGHVVMKFMIIIVMSAMSIDASRLVSTVTS